MALSGSDMSVRDDVQTAETGMRDSAPSKCQRQGEHVKARLLSPQEAADRSGWPRPLLEDPAKQPRVVDDVAEFLAFVCYEDHSGAQMCVLRGGVRKLGLEGSLPPRFLRACARHTDAIDCTLEAVDWEDVWGRQEGLDGDVFWWPPGESRRKIVSGGSLSGRLLRCRQQAGERGLAYLAELSRDRKTPHHLTGERCRVLTDRDVKDCVEGRLPMWDRGHCFLGAEGAGSCMHVDQAWWSNVGKNFLGQKLVALWPPDEAEAALRACGGELFRRPLTPQQRSVLGKAARVALLGPGDVASFTGGLPHVTSVVGDVLNLTAYESFVNWNPANVDLLLRGAARPREKGVMALGPLHGLLDDIVEAVEECAAAGGLPDVARPLQCGRRPADLLRAFRLALLRRPHCAKRMLRDPSCTMASTDVSSSPSPKSSSSSEHSGEERGVGSPPARRAPPQGGAGAPEAQGPPVGAAALEGNCHRQENSDRSSPAGRVRPRDPAPVRGMETPGPAAGGAADRPRRDRSSSPAGQASPAGDPVRGGEAAPGPAAGGAAEARGRPRRRSPPAVRGSSPADGATPGGEAAPGLPASGAAGDPPCRPPSPAKGASPPDDAVLGGGEVSGPSCKRRRG